MDRSYLTWKSRTLLCGLRSDFSVIGKAIRMSDKSFSDVVSHLIVKESSKDETDWHQKTLIANHQIQGSNQSNNRECYRYDKKEHISYNCISGKQSTYSGKQGHFAKKCWNNPNSASFREDCTCKKSENTVKLLNDKNIGR